MFPKLDVFPLHRISATLIEGEWVVRNFWADRLRFPDDEFDWPFDLIPEIRVKRVRQALVEPLAEDIELTFAEFRARFDLDEIFAKYPEFAGAERPEIFVLNMLTYWHWYFDQIHQIALLALRYIPNLETEDPESFAVLKRLTEVDINGACYLIDIFASIVTGAMSAETN